MPKHEHDCPKNPKNKKLLSADKKLSFAKRYGRSLKKIQVDMSKLEERALGLNIDPFEKQMIKWNGWEIIAEDKENNCLIVKVPLGDK